MASAFTKRLLNLNLLKIKDFTRKMASTTKNSIWCNLDNNSRSCMQIQFRATLIPIQEAPYALKYYSTSRKASEEVQNNDKDKGDDDDKELKDKNKQLSIFKKFKMMYRDYWYVLVPVHLVTSVAWFGSFYYMAKSGIDVVALLESCHVSERFINPLKDSSMGYIAVSYALYKIATPARYTVTLGGTTLAINYLKKKGYIKPVPSKKRMKEIYHLKKEEMKEKTDELLESLQEKKEEIKEKKEHIVESVKETKKKLSQNKFGNKKKITIKDKSDS